MFIKNFMRREGLEGRGRKQGRFSIERLHRADGEYSCTKEHFVGGESVKQVKNLLGNKWWYLETSLGESWREWKQ